MSSKVLFGLSVLMSFVAFGTVTKLYILPKLRVSRREDALVSLMVPHTFRFVGLSFLIPGVVSLHLSAAFAILQRMVILSPPFLRSSPYRDWSFARRGPFSQFGSSTCGEPSTSCTLSTKANSLASARVH